MDANPSLTEPQARFFSLECAFPAFVGGFGSGKTRAACAKLCKSAWTDPKVPLGYFGPTQPDIKQFFFPSIDECAADWGLNASYRRGDLEVDLYRGRSYRATIICRSMQQPESIRGFNIGRGVADELDTLKTEHARQAWNKIIARRRYQFDGAGWIGVTTTPEGFRFTYDLWVRRVREKPELGQKYQLVRASTRSNEIHLQPDYIETLLATYPENLIGAYIEGEFVNLAQGTVYVQYDSKENASTETIQKGDALHVGMDFNVGKMAAVIHVERDGKPHAVDEIMGAYDTPDMVRLLKERYWQYIDGDYRATHQIRIYPDSTGGGRRTVNANETDIRLLKDAGFVVSAAPANPPVKDRVNTMNAMFCNAKGERRYFVNAEKCPTYAEALTQQAYNDRGEPDKAHDQDHPNDAAGYYIHRRYPLTRPVTRLNIGVAT